MSKEEQGQRSEDLPDDESARSLGLMAILSIVTIIGIAIWFIASQNETT